MMQVDPNTMLFFDMTDEEAEDLAEQVEDLILKGTNVYNTKAFQIWNAACKSNNPAFGLLTMATVYPQRALLSLLRRYPR